MRIGIIASPLAEKEKTGIAVYSWNLIKHLCEIDSENTYILYTNKLLLVPITKSNFLVKKFSFPSRGWSLTRLQVELLFQKLDILFSLNLMLPFYSPCKTILTVYDLGFIDSSIYFPWYSRIGHLLMKTAIMKANKIIAISSATKSDIVKKYDIDPQKIKIIYLGYDKNIYHNNYPKDEIKETIKKYKIANKYILYVGHLNKRKNVTGLIKAFSSLKQNKKIEHKLLLIGKKGWGNEEIFQIIESLNLQKDVMWLGFVPSEEIAKLMNGADVFVLPSLYEGFGLVALEAMACGTPVIVSNTSSLPEVVNNAGITVNPYNINELAEAIYEVLTNENLKQELIYKGIQRAKNFSWLKCAEETLELFKETIFEKK